MASNFARCRGLCAVQPERTMAAAHTDDSEGLWVSRKVSDIR